MGLAHHAVQLPPSHAKLFVCPHWQASIVSSGSFLLLVRGFLLQVYLGSRAGGQKVALKVLSATAQQAATLQRLRQETALLQRVSFDANVVQFYGASLQHAADAVLVMECASHLPHDV